MTKEQLQEKFKSFLENQTEFENYLKFKQSLGSGIINVTGVYTDDINLIDNLLTIISASKGVNLREYSRRVLKYYIKYGYTDEAKEYIVEDYLEEIKVTSPDETLLKKLDQRIRTANVDLRDLGFLNHGTNNMRKSKLSDEMEFLRKKIDDGSFKHLLITLNHV